MYYFRKKFKWKNNQVKDKNKVFGAVGKVLKILWFKCQPTQI